MRETFRAEPGFILGALIVSVVIFGALALGGANSAAQAALLSCALLTILAATLATTPRELIEETWLANRISILAAVAYVIWALITALPVRWTHLPPHPLWTLASAPDAAMSLAPYRTLEGIAAFLGPAAAFILGALLTPNRIAREWLFRWVTCLAVAYALFSLYLYLSTPPQLARRLDGGLSSANGAATCFAMFAIIALAVLVRAARGKIAGTRAPQLPKLVRRVEFVMQAPISLGLLVLSLACLMLTASRGGAIALAVALLTFVAAISLPPSTPGSRMRGAPILAIGGLCLALVLWRGREVFDRLLSADGAELHSRLQLIETHWRAFLQHPLQGHGLNTYHEINSLSATVENWRVLDSAGAAHNIYVQALEESGALGLILLAAMLAPQLVLALRHIMTKASGNEWAAAALALSAVVFTHGLVDFGLQIPAIAALYCFALGAAIGRPYPAESKRA